MGMKTITITLEAAAWNVVLAALASRPYAEVFQLIPDIQKQAEYQITSTNQVSSERQVPNE
jgi:hypothetical protein